MIEKRNVDIDGLRIHYLTAGEGRPMVLLHALSESALDWSWVLPVLARTHHVYAPDLPGFGDSDKPDVDYTPDFFTRFIANFLNTLGIERTVMIGNSLGGLAALRLALSAPSRVAALILVDSSGLGREIHPSLSSLTLPGYGDLAAAWGQTSIGARQRVWLRTMLLFARPWLAPSEWVREQIRLAQVPGFLDATLAALRAQVSLRGQREVLLDQLPRLTMPTLLIWGTDDRVVPVSQAQDAVTRLQHGQLVLISKSGHLPQVERPGRFVTTLNQFLTEEVYS